MKKVHIILSLCMLAIPGHAMERQAQTQRDWRVESNSQKAEEYARNYFTYKTMYIKIQDIQDALKRFPTFLTWDYEGDNLLFRVIKCTQDPAVVRYVLGFGFDLTAKSSSGNTIREIIEIRKVSEFTPVFNEYEQNPWFHNLDKERAKSELEPFIEPESSSWFCSGKALGAVAVLAVLGIGYKYFKSYCKDKK